MDNSNDDNGDIWKILAPILVTTIVAIKVMKSRKRVKREREDVESIKKQIFFFSDWIGTEIG